MSHVGAAAPVPFEAETVREMRMSENDLGPLVSAEWLAQHVDDPSLRIVHVSVDRETFSERHIPGAVFSDLHVDFAQPGLVPETGSFPRTYLVPPRGDVAATLAAWGVGEGGAERIVFYDDVGQNRHAIRGYWLLRLYGFPRERAALLDGGLSRWESLGLTTTAQVRPLPAAAPPPLSDADRSLIATADEVVAWSRQSVEDGNPRILDVRSVDEFLGRDVRAARGGRVPTARHRIWTDFLTPDDRIRTPEDSLAILRGTGIEPNALRAVYCQGGVRAALVWFVLHELAGCEGVRNYAGSWEEWGNRRDLPVES